MVIIRQRPHLTRSTHTAMDATLSFSFRVLTSSGMALPKEPDQKHHIKLALSLIGLMQPTNRATVLLCLYRRSRGGVFGTSYMADSQNPTFMFPLSLKNISNNRPANLMAVAVGGTSHASPTTSIINPLLVSQRTGDALRNALPVWWKMTIQDVDSQVYLTIMTLIEL